VPLLSNTEDEAEVTGLPPGHVCVYEIEVSQNKDSREILEVEVQSVEGARLGVDFWQMGENGQEQARDMGFLSKDNCSMEVNCTTNMRGKHVYYLSGV
jgi:hypothetical protein